jgi:hypothetical protein
MHSIEMMGAIYCHGEIDHKDSEVRMADFDGAQRHDVLWSFGRYRWTKIP